VTTSLEESSERRPCLTGGPVERGEAATGQLSALVESVGYPDDACFKAHQGRLKRVLLSYKCQKTSKQPDELSGFRVKETHDVGTEIDEVCNLVQVRVDIVSVESHNVERRGAQNCI
jgi:hypothetical protein